MRKRVSIVDYGIGNVLSVKRAFEKVGAETEFVCSKEGIEKADYLVLPGVGAFKNGMIELENRGIAQAVQEYCSENRPFLGICLGMQMMLQESEEFGICKGLGIIEGKVLKIPSTDVNGKTQKIPCIGWNKLEAVNTEWNDTILAEIGMNSYVYFVHSYMAVPDYEENRLADSFYGGQRISVAIKKGNCYGTQFHPEKSGLVGIKILNNFINI